MRRRSVRSLMARRRLLASKCKMGSTGERMETVDEREKVADSVFDALAH